MGNPVDYKTTGIGSFRSPVRQRRLVAIGWLVLALLVFLPALLRAAEIGTSSPTANAPAADKAPAAIASALAAGTSQDVIVLFDDRQIAAEAAARRQKAGLAHDDEAVLNFKAGSYRLLKEGATAGFTPYEAETLRDYSHLPMRFMRIHTKAALDRLLARPEVVAVYENRKLYPVDAANLTLINQPAENSTGLTGSGSTVAVIDTGIDYTLSDFGSCTAPGTPAGCRVVASVDETGNNVILNTAPNNHGTNVSGVVAAVAPGAQIASVNVFSNGSTTVDLVVAGINWAITNKSAYNIVAINMSLGDGGDYTSVCDKTNGPLANPFISSIASAQSVGILSVAASGNNGYTNGISSPACTPGVISVGAVYDANWGGWTWNTGSSSTCTDATSAADQVICFSNSASFLTILAPGSFVTAAGVTMSGTSQATPHVAGGIAILRSASPGDPLAQTPSRLTGSGTPITDPRNSVTTPRLNLLAALGTPVNDNFAAARALGSNSGQLTADNANATKEQGEPNHAGNPGGKSVWWSWTPSASGLASFDTHGSDFDTLLAVYTGTAVSALTQVTANDNDGPTGNTSGLTFMAQTGTTYMIAVDGSNGTFGSINLDWSLTPQADLAVTMTQSPASLIAGTNLTYTLTVTNSGPSDATGVVLTDPLPAGVSFVSASSGCSQSAGTVTCTLGTLANGGNASVQIVVTPTQAGSLTNTVYVTSAVQDPTSADNSASIAATVAAPPAPVPALSPWGIAGTAGLLLLGLAGSSRPGKNRHDQP